MELVNKLLHFHEEIIYVSSSVVPVTCGLGILGDTCLIWGVLGDLCCNAVLALSLGKGSTVRGIWFI